MSGKKGSEIMHGGKGQVGYEKKEDTLVIRVKGEIDHHSAVGVRTGMDDVLTAERPERVYLDLSGVRFMDSSGLGLIMGRYALVKKYGGKFAVLDPSAAVRKMLDLAGMDKTIPVKKSKTVAGASGQ